MRATAQPSSLDIPWPDLTGSPDDPADHWRSWLQQVWACESIAAAIEVASPSLAHRVREVRDQPPRQIKRAVVSVIRYLLRATSRPTPFGLFAGVAPARFGDKAQVCLGGQHRAVARVDAEWLASVVSRLETCPDLRRRLSVALNNLTFVRDGRLVVGCQRQAGASTGTAPAEISVRYTRAIETVCQAARSSIPVGDLLDKLRVDFPSTPEPVIEKMLAELVTQRLLITSLCAPMTSTDPLTHVVSELEAVSAVDIPDVAGLVQEVRDVHVALSRHNRASSPTEQRDLRTAATARMKCICASERPISVDLRVDGSVVLPHEVAREAEAAADVLTRLSPHPGGTPDWRDYHARFLERYGMGALVPLLQLVDGDIGLGFPAGYRDSRLKPVPTPGLSKRDEALLALAQQAAIDHSREVALDEQTIAQLAADDPIAVQPHTELRFSLHAPTSDAVNQGEFLLTVAGVSRTAGATTGRFLDLLDPADQKRMLTTYRQLSTVNDDAIPVQVSCPTLSPRAENVARSPRVLPHVVSMAEHQLSRAETIPLDDLAVTGDAEHLCLMSLSQHRPVEPVVFSAVEFTNAAHPLLRFLCEITTARAAACAPFTWGAASRMPFLPRIRYGRTILSPARWTFTTADLSGADWLSSWRQRYFVPAWVNLSEDDRRLRLNLDEPAHQHLLRTEVERAGHATLREAPDDTALGWCDGRAHEIVVPLTATQPHRAHRTWPGRVISTEHGHLPGASEWLYLKLYGHPDRHTTILTAHLPKLLASWNGRPEWWFQRYQDPEPHLRLRIRLPGNDSYGDSAQRVGMWTANLRRHGLVGRTQFDTYYPETGRFGDGDAITAAESVFAADSAAAIAQLTTNGPHPHAITAASLVDLAISFAGAVDAGMRWLIEHIDRATGQALAQDMRDQAIRLADPSNNWAVLRATPAGQDIATAWATRRSTLAAYRDTLVTTGETAPEVVLPDLIHLHVVRMVGLSPEIEQTCARLARAAALSWTARTTP